VDLCILYVRAGVLRYGGNRKSKMGQIIQEGTIERILENKRKRGRGKENAGMSGCVRYVDEEKNYATTRSIEMMCRSGTVLAMCTYVYTFQCHVRAGPIR